MANGAMQRVGVASVAEAQSVRISALGDGAAKAKPGEYDAYVQQWGVSTVALARRVGEEFHVVVNVELGRAHDAGALQIDPTVAVLVDGTIQPA